MYFIHSQYFKQYNFLLYRTVLFKAWLLEAHFPHELGVQRNAETQSLPQADWAGPNPHRTLMYFTV